MSSMGSRTIAIVGAGFSGTALAYRLLRSKHAVPTRVVLIERAQRFGPGLAYSAHAAGTTLNVPAGRMSIDEAGPGDLLEYLHARAMSVPPELSVTPEEFVPRRLYGDYLEARLADAARAASPRAQLTRVNRVAIGVSQADDNSRGARCARWWPRPVQSCGAPSRSASTGVMSCSSCAHRHTLPRLRVSWPNRDRRLTCCGGCWACELARLASRTEKCTYRCESGDQAESTMQSELKIRA